MSNLTTISRGVSYDYFMKHKEYFDSSFVQLLNKQQKKIAKLETATQIRQATIQKQKYQIKATTLKNNDLQIINYNLKQLLKETEKDAETIIKEMDEEIKNINKKIDDELQKTYRDNAELYDENTRLKQEIERLKKQYKMNHTNKKDSTNSSMPPSTDMYKRVCNSRTKSEYKRGGKKGHPVHQSKLIENVNKIINKKVSHAPKGAEAIYNTKGSILYYRTQEVDAYMKIVVSETRYFLDEESANLSADEMNRYAINAMTYAPRVKSMMIYLNSKGTIAAERLCKMMSELSESKLDIKPSTLMKWHKEFYEKSTNQREAIRKEIIASPIVHVDETGWKINGKRAWMHVMVTDQVSYFEVTEGRGNQEEGPLKHLQEYEGYLIHDHYKPYYNLRLCKHGECNAHIMRYLKAGFEFDESTECLSLLQLLKEMCDQKKELLRQGIRSMSIESIEAYEERYHTLLINTLEMYEKKHPKIKSKYKPNYIKLMKRMEEYSEEHLQFIKDFDVPFDNNAAERQMRPTKAKKKISGQSLSKETANYFAAIHTINQTCVLQNKNTLDTIKGILS